MVLAGEMEVVVLDVREEDDEGEEGVFVTGFGAGQGYGVQQYERMEDIEEEASGVGVQLGYAGVVLPPQQAQVVLPQHVHMQIHQHQQQTMFAHNLPSQTSGQYINFEYPQVCFFFRFRSIFHT
jgi:hypothetical protein